jgi:hypothetical protein
MSSNSSSLEAVSTEIEQRMSTNSSPLEKLPIEVLHHICSHLPRPSLTSLSLCNKALLSAADVFFFRAFTITVLGRKKLKDDVDKWKSVLRRSQSFKHVRRLYIRGYMPEEHDDTGEVDLAAEGVKDRFFMKDHIDDPLASCATEAAAWQPLADLLELLIALASLNFRSSNQLPRVVLGVLHSKQRRHDCKLEMARFRLRSLHEDTIDPHEYALITSPCLSIIDVKCGEFDSQKRSDHNLQAILSVVERGLAPNLRELRIQGSAMSWPRFRTSPPPPELPWKGFGFDEDSLLKDRSNKKGCISTLSLSYLTSTQMKPLTDHLDFYKIRRLVIQSSLMEHSSQTIPWLQSLTLNKLHHLRSLDLNIYCMSPDEGYYQAFDSFFQSLRPRLRDLRISAHLRPKSIHDILRRHGASLLHLCLNLSPSKQALGMDNVRQIHKYCHALERLEIPIQRTQGDAEEVKIYRILGSLPKLARLSITLKSIDISPNLNNNLLESVSTNFNTFEQQPFLIGGQPMTPPRLNGDIRNSFINRAVDETLARSIYDVLSSTKQPGCKPIESLTLHHDYVSFLRREEGDHVQYPSAVEEYLNTTWLLRRETCHNEQTCSTETKVDVRSGDWLGRTDRKKLLPTTLHPDLEAVFRSVWPRRENDTGNWKEDWHSFPLATT